MTGTMNGGRKAPVLHEAHELALLVPRPNAEDRERLRNDIAAHGLIDPIVLFHNKILDGVTREELCDELGIKPRYTQYKETEAEAATFVFAKNVARRHLTPGQKAMLAAKLLPVFEKAAKARQGKRTDLDGNIPAKSPESSHTEARTQAGNAVGVRPRSVSTAKRLKKERPDLAEKVEAGTMTLGAADEALKAGESTEPQTKKAAGTTRVVKRASKVWEELQDPAVREEVKAQAGDSKLDRQALAAVAKLERELDAIEADQQRREAQRQKEELKLLEAHLSGTDIKTWDGLTNAMITAAKILRAYRLAIVDVPPPKDVWLRGANREMMKLRNELDWLDKVLNPNGPEPENAVRRGSVIDATAS